MRAVNGDSYRRDMRENISIARIRVVTTRSARIVDDVDVPMTSGTRSHFGDDAAPSI
jgi:hypothetical protein